MRGSWNSEPAHLLHRREPALNDFAVAGEVQLKGNHARRPDVVLHVDGLAVDVLSPGSDKISTYLTQWSLALRVPQPRQRIEVAVRPGIRLVPICQFVEHAQGHLRLLCDRQ